MQDPPFFRWIPYASTSIHSKILDGTLQMEEQVTDVKPLDNGRMEVQRGRKKMRPLVKI